MSTGLEMESSLSRHILGRTDRREECHKSISFFRDFLRSFLGGGYIWYIYPSLEKGAGRSSVKTLSPHTCSFDRVFLVNPCTEEKCNGLEERQCLA